MNAYSTTSPQGAAIDVLGSCNTYAHWLACISAAAHLSLPGLRQLSPRSFRCSPNETLLTRKADGKRSAPFHQGESVLNAGSPNVPTCTEKHLAREKPDEDQEDDLHNRTAVPGFHGRDVPKNEKHGEEGSPKHPSQRDCSRRITLQLLAAPL